MTELVEPTTPHELPDEADAFIEGSAEGLTDKSLSPRQMAVRRYFKHKGAFMATIIMAIMVLFVLLSPLTTRYGVNEAIFKAEPGQPNSYLSPRGDAWFGTDDIGRDIYSRMIYGLRVSLIIGISAAIFATIVGVTVGSFAGLHGGRFDDLLMRVTDIFLAFPFLVALLVVRNFLGELEWLTPIVGDRTSIRFIILLFVIFGWMGVARLVRGSVLALKEREFVEAARALGASNFRIVFRHLLPNSIGPILVALTNTVVAAIIGEATLSFFGFGPDAGSGQTSLGLLVSAAKGGVTAGFWWMVVFPCTLLVLVALCINFIGDGLRDATDPKLVHGG
ncbi:MAG: ABC transporter permease [Ilumatobacter sp.]|uniref:ABC transporter permease n=1 Tax=Ilumatobacter sp. TaxID=1967498 RepID=UPI00261353D1|nr:ABC transporter permease [Ilumatobacter sp.]MDJ0767325.1 ABC transporter permease [Ilumatobacter sp.]